MTHFMSGRRSGRLECIVAVLVALACSAIEDGAAVAAAPASQDGSQVIAGSYGSGQFEGLPVMGSGTSRQLRQYSKDVVAEDDGSGAIEALPVMGSDHGRPLDEFDFEAYQSKSSAKAD